MRSAFSLAFARPHFSQPEPATYCWAAIEEIDATLSLPLHHGRPKPQAARRSRAASARLAARSTFSRAPRTFAGNLTPD